MNETIINAIRTIRTYAFEREPENDELQRKILTAKWQGMSGLDLRTLLEQQK